ncbi:hypothetical protein ACQ4PT_049330 [Festuca glaucescens]
MVKEASSASGEKSSPFRYLALNNNNKDYGRKTRANNLQFHDLPPDILDNILSRLSFKELVCTSILSSRCRPLWRSCSRDLVFNKDTMCCPTHEREDFIRNVDSVLCQLSPTTPRDKFVLEFKLIKSDVQCHVDSWVAFCVASRAKHIVFDFNPGSWGYKHGNSFSFPLHHFSNGAPVITTLCLMSAYLNPQPLLPGFCGFTNLRKLKLDSVFGDIRSLLLPACAVLEWLSIVRCRLHSLTTSQPLCRLRYLCVQYCFEVHQLEVKAPNLATFNFASLDDNPVPFMLDGCLEIQEVTVTLHTVNDLFDYAFAEHGFAHVPKLSVELPIDSKVVGFAKFPSKFVNLRHLILTLNVFVHPDSTRGLLRLACLLELAPVLEQLELHMDCHRGVGERKLVPLEELPQAYRPHGHLKTVEMTGVYSYNNLLTLALYFARNAMALERMVIDPMAKRSFALTRGKTAVGEIVMGRLLAREHLLGRGLDDILTIL